MCKFKSLHHFPLFVVNESPKQFSPKHTSILAHNVWVIFFKTGFRDGNMWLNLYSLSRSLRNSSLVSISFLAVSPKQLKGKRQLKIVHVALKLHRRPYVIPWLLSRAI